MPKKSRYNIQKPFLKWLGGKTQIIDHILDKIPREIGNYHEPFVGGGSVLLAVLSLHEQRVINITGKIYASDINRNLITVYKHIKTHKDQLYDIIDSYINEYASIEATKVNRNPQTIEEARTSKESYYYWMRNKFNRIDTRSIERSALFMILNKTCFRGMYRESKNGFNVPYGHYKRVPTIITKKDLNRISQLIQPVEFRCLSFVDAFKDIQAGDFVYLDPPYAPEKPDSFVKYTAGGFDLDCHKQLFSATRDIGAIGAKFLLSNSKVDMVLEAFNDTKYKYNYKCEELIVRRAINSKRPGSQTTEVLIYNYQPYRIPVELRV